MNIFDKLFGGYALLAKGIALLVLIAGCYGSYLLFVRHERDIGRAEIQKKFDDYKKLQEMLVEKQKQLDLAYRTQAEAQKALVKSNYEAKIAELNLLKAKTEKDLKDALPRISSLLNDLRVYQHSRETTSGAGVPVNALSTELSTTCGQDTDRAVAAVVSACQSTTLSYKALYNAWLAECTAHGGCVAGE